MTPDGQALSQVMAELHELGSLDPAAHAKLTDDLRQTDPSLWPLVVQQFRAAMAYKQQVAVRSHADSRIEFVADRETPWSPDPARPAPVQRPPTPGLPASPSSPLPAPISPPVGRLPSADNTALPPACPPVGAYPTTDAMLPGTEPPSTPSGPRVSTNTAAQIVAASYAPAPERDWQAHLGESIRALEARLQATPESTEQITEHARLRLMYVLAGRRDDALAPIPRVPAPVEEFWCNEALGLDTWLDRQRTPQRDRRAVEAKRHLGQAVASLAALAPLVVHNLDFCTAVHSYGSVERFSKREFHPNQEVLLYAEVDNFKSEETPKGHHTALRGSYQIFDSSGHRVADYEFPKTEETCDRPRRDFFIGYHLRLPQSIYPGKQTLKLTIEDLLSHKVGQASIEFTVKRPKD